VGFGRQAEVRRVVPPLETRRTLHSNITTIDIIHCWNFGRRNETSPCFVALMDDLGGILLVLGFTRERKCIFGLSVGDFVDPEPFISRPDETGKVPLNVLNIVELGGKWILNIDDEDFPVGFSFIEQRHDTQNFDLLDLANVSHLLTDFTDVKGVIVAFGLCLGVRYCWVFPSLRESAVIPNVSVMREAVPHKAQLATLDVLLDGVERFVFRDLHLRVSPTGNLNNHVEDAVVLIGEERDVVKRGHDRAILLDINAVINCVWCASEAGRVLGGHGTCGC